MICTVCKEKLNDKYHIKFIVNINELTKFSKFIYDGGTMHK